MSLLSEEVRFRLGGLVGDAVVRALFATVRFYRGGAVEAVDSHRAAGGRVIFVAWHDQLLPLMHAHRGQGLAALVSEHADGEYIARVLERHGFETARGSSTRGGARGLRQLLRWARRGRDLAVIPDGPRGPRHRFKEGALLAAQLSGLPVVPLAGAATSAWHFDSWDRFMLPRPFSTVRLLYGSPRPIPRDAERDERERLAGEMEAELNALTARAAGAGIPERRAEHPDGAPDVSAAGTPRGREEREDGHAPLA